jgi:hypothetical protein
MTCGGTARGKGDPTSIQQIFVLDDSPQLDDMNRRSLNPGNPLVRSPLHLPLHMIARSLTDPACVGILAAKRLAAHANTHPTQPKFPVRANTTIDAKTGKGYA